jgi:hypothetical protein
LPSSSEGERRTTDLSSFEWLNERNMTVKADPQDSLSVLRMSLAADIAKGAA